MKIKFSGVIIHRRREVDVRYKSGAEKLEGTENPY